MESTDRVEEPAYVLPVLARWLRLLLVLVAVLLLIVFGVALWLNPYSMGGEALTSEAHMQLGLPQCTFKEKLGLPCPSCGMTTSFALLMHGDLVNSLRANLAGTALALFCLFLIPWNLLSAWLGRPLFILSIEGALVRLVVIFLVLTLARWGIVLLTILT